MCGPAVSTGKMLTERERDLSLLEIDACLHIFNSVSTDFKIHSRSGQKVTDQAVPIATRARRVLHSMIHSIDRLGSLAIGIDSKRTKRQILFDYIDDLGSLEDSLSDFFAANPTPSTAQLRNKILGLSGTWFGVLGEMKAAILTKNLKSAQMYVKDIISIRDQKRLSRKDKKGIWAAVRELEIDLVQSFQGNKQVWIEVKYINGEVFHERRVGELIKRAMKLKRLTGLLRRLNINVELKYLFLGSGAVSPKVIWALENKNIAIENQIN